MPQAKRDHSLYAVPKEIPDRLACLIEPFTVGCRAARRGQPKPGEHAVVFGSGGYFQEDVRDVMDIMASGRWNLESVITHEFPIDEIDEAIRTASDADKALNVTIKF